MIHVDLILRLGSLWVGGHYSERHRSWCIAPFPCIVFRIGKTPYTTKERSGKVFHLAGKETT